MCVWRSLIYVAPDVEQVTIGVSVNVGAGQQLETADLNEYIGYLDLRMAGPGTDSSNNADEVLVKPESINRGDVQYYELTWTVPDRAKGSVQTAMIFQQDGVGERFQPMRVRLSVSA
jgi:hypothetical protein